MHDDDEITITDPALPRPRRWAPSLRIGRGGRPHPARHSPTTVTIVISVDCPTPGCPDRLHFGATGDDEGLTSECATCRRPFVLTAGDVELRSAPDAAPQEDAG